MDAGFQTVILPSHVQMNMYTFFSLVVVSAPHIQNQTWEGKWKLVSGHTSIELRHIQMPGMNCNLFKLNLTQFGKIWIQDIWSEQSQNDRDAQREERGRESLIVPQHWVVIQGSGLCGSIECNQ